MNAEPTYTEPTFRIYPAERLKGDGGKVLTMQLCEELDPESGRWEAFYSVLKVERAAE